MAKGSKDPKKGDLDLTPGDAASVKGGQARPGSTRPGTKRPGTKRPGIKKV